MDELFQGRTRLSEWVPWVWSSLRKWHEERKRYCVVGRGSCTVVDSLSVDEWIGESI